MNKTERVITYTNLDNVPDQSGEDEVSGWVAAGEDERDLLSDTKCSRGWEAGAVMVVELGGFPGVGTGVPNLVMRGRTCVVLVTDKKETEDNIC